VWASVCCRPAKKHFPDGVNMHVTVMPLDWWQERVNDANRKRRIPFLPDGDAVVGFGDWIMATGQVARALRAPCEAGLHRGHRRQNHSGNVGCSKKQPEDFACVDCPVSPVLLNGPNARPYIASKTPQRWTWRKHQLHPGEIYLTAQEKQFGAPLAAGKVMIEPHVKGTGHGNKAWAVGSMASGSRFRRRQLRAMWPRRHCMAAWRGMRHNTDIPARVRPYCIGHAHSWARKAGLHHAAAAMHVPRSRAFSQNSSDLDSPATRCTENIAHATFSCGSRIPCASLRRFDGFDFGRRGRRRIEGDLRREVRRSMVVA
jgi:hypothetical protein